MSIQNPSAAIVIPCFNEEARLDPPLFFGFLSREPRVRLVLVDDGSSDATWQLVEEMRIKKPDRVTTLRMPENRGKAEAVRCGVLEALATPVASGRTFEFIGYWDADLAAPLEHLSLFLDHLEREGACSVVLGSRVRLLGRDIQRRPFRHYAGRVFSTLASLVLDLPVYDTQCGAKVFRSGEELRVAFSEPFRDPWIFDVELLARLRSCWPGEAHKRFHELPLPSWHHMPGSKVKFSDGIRAGYSLMALWLKRSRSER